MQCQMFMYSISWLKLGKTGGWEKYPVLEAKYLENSCVRSDEPWASGGVKRKLQLCICNGPQWENRCPPMGYTEG